jgi:hypothetical protein
MKEKRPFLLWLLCFIYLLAAAAELLQAAGVVTQWNILQAVAYQPGPLYPLFIGCFFFLLFLASALLLWLRAFWAAEFAGAAALLFAIWFWLDKFVVAVNPQPFADQVFNLIVCIVVLTLVLVSVHALKPFMNTPQDNVGRN